MFGPCVNMCQLECNPHLILQQSNLELFKTAILAKVSDDQLVEVWLKLLNQLIEDLER